MSVDCADAIVTRPDELPPVPTVDVGLSVIPDGAGCGVSVTLPCAVAPFHEAVLHELARVPYGRTETYGSLAAKVGRPNAARAVGTVMNRNPIPIVLPCHRVIGANGSLVGYAGGLEIKRRLLALEGALPLQLET